MMDVFKAMREITSKSFLLCLAVRVFSVFFIQTSFVPDEYWQSLEVAHNMSFGYGYSTWEWRLGIRSYFHPVFIAFLYQILAFFQIDTVEAVILLPRLTQAILSTVCDSFFVKWHRTTTSSNGNWAWFTVITSWFWFYCASRTLANTLETCLAMIGLNLYPWEQVVLHHRPWRFARNRRNVQGKHTYLWVVAIACVLRPTAGIFWLPLVVCHVTSMKRMTNFIFSKCFPIATTALVVSYKFDSYFHGESVFTWWNFFTVNALKGVGNFYGSQSFLWYFFAGLPTVLGALVLPFGMSVTRVLQCTTVLNMEIIMVVTLFWTICVLSLLSHKEFRFLLPILPLCFHLSASWLSHWSRHTKGPRRYAVAVLITVSSILTSTYVGHFHQRGTLDVMAFLAKESSLNPSNTNLLFLMPCHSTPLYSHLHVNVTTRFLTCEPDVFNASTYVDEAEVFFSHPEGWLNQVFPTNGTSQFPTHIIIFDTLREEIAHFLDVNGYLFTMGFYHTRFPTERVGKNVLVFKRVAELHAWPPMALD